MSKSMHKRKRHEADTHATKDCKVDDLGIGETLSSSRTPGEGCEFCVAAAAEVDGLKEQLHVASTSVAAPNNSAALAKELASVKATLEARNRELRAKNTELRAKDAELQAKDSEIGHQNKKIKQAAVDLESENNMLQTLTSDNAKLKRQLLELNVSTNTARAAAEAMAATLDETKQIAEGLRGRHVAANKSKLAAEKKLGCVEAELVIIKKEHVGNVQLREEILTLRRQLKDEVRRSCNAARESAQARADTLAVEQRLKAVGVTQCDLTNARCGSTLLVTELEQLRARFAQAEEEYDVQSRQLRSARAKLGLPTTYY
jgi:small-conductance mechanosensitive channel